MAATLDNTADGTAGIVLERPCNSRPNHPTDVTAQSPAPACGTHAPGLAAEVAMKPSPEKSPQEVLAGVVERVTYHNVENGFCVLRAKARGHRDVVTVVGHAATIAAGEWITASGEWVNDRTHGQQFKARFLRTSPPTSADGIEKYLSSGMIRGVGPAYAKKLLHAFGEKVFDIIEASPDRLREVDGIGPVRASRITAAWAEQKAVREIMVFLHSHGVGTARAVRIYKTYGPDAIQVMTENPYRLARDIRGIGFKTADAIAMKLGIEKTALVRVRAGISYALTEAMDEGHCGLPTEELIPLAEKLLEVPQELIRTALDLELQQGTVVADRVGETPCVFLAGLHRAERTIAERLIRLANRKLPWPWIDPDKALPWIERRIGLALAESQVAAIRLALMSKVLVMTGGPGVGKTTIVNAILRILAAKGTNLLLCAPTGRAAKRKAVIHVADLAAEQAYIKDRVSPAVAAVELGGVRTILAVPMLNKSELIGSFTVYRQEVRPFTDKQIALITNFAAQAVIAIENARLLNELRQRTTDLSEALEQQTATSDVLQVMSSSPGDVEPVFAAMLENASRICDANFGNIFHWDGDALHLIATHNTPPSFAEYRKRRPPNLPFARMVSAKAVVHCADAAALPAYTEQHDAEVAAAVELGGIRTFVAVPMLKEDKLIGALIVYRQEARPFTDKQIELVKNFAAQAVIAIENARLLNELRERTMDLTEALEQQTATSNVLQVISSSPGNLEPVFETMLENAVRLCDAKFGTINRWDGEALHLVATYNVPSAFAEFRKRTPFRPGPENPISQMLMTKTVIHFRNLATEQGYIERNPTFVAAVELGGVRTFLAVPMMKENELVGVVIVYRQEVRPFSDKQIELVKSFAAQAVIAIENARLLNELRQSLEQQTATADVLKVISRSTFDLQKVLDTLVTSAAQLCRAERASITLPEGARYHRVASFGFSAEFRDFLDRHPLAIDRGNIVGRVVLEGRTLQIEDVEADPEFTFVEALRIGKARTLLGVPLMRQGRPMGVLVLTRSAVEPFSDKHTELVETFADQAVIAIENARLLKELRERTDDVQKLNQQLEHRVADQVGEIERMSRLRRFLPPQVADLIVASGSEKQLESHRR